MHPKHVELFAAIYNEDLEALKQFINTNPQSTWLLNDANQSAIDYALNTESTRSVNVLLAKLSHDANISIRTPEAQEAFHFALLKVVKFYCKNHSTENHFKFYQSPEKIFTFLTETNKDWITWTHGIALQQGAAYNAYNEMMYTKPKIQNFIRAQATAQNMTKFFRENNQITALEVLRELCVAISRWENDPMFSQHSGWISAAASFVGKKTATADTFTKLKEAANFLAKNNLAIPEVLDLEMAKKIMLLCTKCYPFSTVPMQTVWVNLTHALLMKFRPSPTEYHALFEPLLDKQWLSTSENIPMVETHLIQQLLPAHVSFYLESYGISLSSNVANNEAVVLSAGEHQELLARYPLPGVQKSFVVDKALSDADKQFLHLLLMNNKNLSLRYTTTELFIINPLKLFPYAPHRIVIDVVDHSQLAHICALAEIASHTQTHLCFAITHELLTEQPSLPALQAIQQILGPKQTFTLLVLDSLEDRNILSDMVISKNDIGSGPYSKAMAAQKQSPSTFYDIYQRFNWTVGLAANTVDLQFRLIELALINNKPTMFIFHRDHFDSELFDRVQDLLKTKKLGDVRCIIRFDNLDATPTQETPIITDCDFVVCSTATMPGALHQMRLCNQPEMYTLAAVTVTNRPSQSSETASTSSQQLQAAPGTEPKSARSETSSVQF